MGCRMLTFQVLAEEHGPQKHDDKRNASRKGEEYI